MSEAASTQELLMLSAILPQLLARAEYARTSVNGVCTDGLAKMGSQPNTEFAPATFASCIGPHAQSHKRLRLYVDQPDAKRHGS
jgi:hypothetical protein